MSGLNVLAAFIPLSIGVLCFLKHKKSLESTLYFLFILSLVLWIGALYLENFFIHIPYISLIFIRLTFGFSAISSAFMCVFAYFYPRKTFVIPLFLKILYILITLGVVIIASFTDLVYGKIMFNDIVIHDVYGSFYVVFVFYYFLNLFLSFFFLLKKIFIMQDIERSKIKLVLLGITIIAFLTIVFHIVFPQFDGHIFQTEGIYLNLLFVVFAGYSMFRYRFFDVRFTVVRLVRQAIAIIFTIFFIHGIWGIIIVIPSLVEYKRQLIPIIYIVSILVYFSVLRGLVSDFLNRFFGRTRIENFRKLLQDFTKNPVLYRTVNEFKIALQDLFQSVDIDVIDIIYINENNEKKYEKFTQYFEQNPEILVQHERLFLPKNKKESAPNLASLGGIHIPLFHSSNVLLGFLILGEKSFNNLYSIEEIKILEEFRCFLEHKMVSIWYSDSLKQEVEEKTRELEKRNEKLLQANAQLQVLGETKDAFLSIASHELRTPMTVISGFTDLLLSDKWGELSEKQKMFLNSISQNSRDLTTLVNKMLDITSLEADKMEFLWKEIKFPVYLEEIVREFEIIALQKQIQIEFQNPNNVSLLLRSDPLKLKQIMGNLLGNALKFTPQNGKIRVLLERNEKDEKCVNVSVIDTGIGIPAEEQERIFEKFYRTKHSDKIIRSGTGLGLHIVKLLIEKLGGEISVISTEKKGSCFTFSLPEQCEK